LEQNEKTFRPDFLAGFNNPMTQPLPATSRPVCRQSFELNFHASRRFIFLADILAEQQAPLLQALQRRTSPLTAFSQIAEAALFVFRIK
jgi:hypothetical protein